MTSKFIAGSNTLEQIEAAIRFEETAFQKAIGSQKLTQDGVAGNAISFEPVNLPRGRLKLVLATNKTPPAGHEKAWGATMTVSGESREVTAWRATGAVVANVAAKKALAAVATVNASEADALPELRPHAAPSRYKVDKAVLLGPDGSAVRQFASPNQSAGNSRKYLIVHYTAGQTLDGAVSWFMNPAARASAHFVVASDGSIVQMVPLDRRAWHAGESRWDGLKSLNAHSIGIEIVNAGKLHRTSRGWVTWAERVVPEDEVTVATHKHESVATGWHEYTAEQIDAVLELGVALHAAFGFKDVLGHDDIAPDRKKDPGPLFPLDALRGRLFGRR